jgi:hypothetical protein
MRTWFGMDAYADRDATLRSLGFASYFAYTHGALWRIVRERALAVNGRECRRCGRLAVQVHHASYLREVLTGEDVSPLWPVCRSCHRHASLRPDGVRALGDANARLARATRHGKWLRKKRRRSQTVLCSCGNQKKVNHSVCRACAFPSSRLPSCGDERLCGAYRTPGGLTKLIRRGDPTRRPRIGVVALQTDMRPRLAPAVR